MLERAREVVQRLLRSHEAPLRKSEPTDHTTGAFDRFLQDYKAHIDEEFEETTQVRQYQPRKCGPRDLPSAPTRK
jgi:hypothetical protein